MLRFLSEEWVAEVNGAMQDLLEPGENEPRRLWTIQCVLVDEAGGSFSYVVRADQSSVTLELGEAGDPDLLLRQDRLTASRIARGELSVPDALAAGLIRARGDLGALGDAAGILAKAARRLSDLSSRTTFPS